MKEEFELEARKREEQEEKKWMKHEGKEENESFRLVGKNPHPHDADFHEIHHFLYYPQCEQCPPSEDSSWVGPTAGKCPLTDSYYTLNTLNSVESVE